MTKKTTELLVSEQADWLPESAAALLRMGRCLWQASDRESVVAHAVALLQSLAPDTTVERRTLETTDHVERGEPASGLRIRVSEHEVVAVSASDASHHGLIDAAADLVEQRIAALDQQAKIAASVERLGRSERLQRALYAIADQASTAGSDLNPMYKALHAIVGTLMYAENFYIALYDTKRDGVWFPYFSDSIDPGPPFDYPGEMTPATAPNPMWPMAGIKQGPTWYLVHDGKPLMGSLESIARQVDGPFQVSGASCKDFLGVPLYDGDEVAGCVVVQSYEQVDQYDEQDRELLVYVAQHIQTTLERRRAHADLEHRVALRTAALKDANKILQKEIRQRKRGERLQATLFQIAELASSTGGIDAFYGAVHRVVSTLLYARNFYIALLTDDGTQLTFPYMADEYDNDYQPRKLANGFTEYVLRTGVALLADEEESQRLCAQGKAQFTGAEPISWLGVPLVCDDNIVGVLAVQSYSTDYGYTERDQNLLTFVSYHIANALEKKHAAESLRDAYEQLEGRVKQRTHALAQANRDLRTQISKRERMEARLKYETLHDSLTGQPNRTLFLQRLAHTLECYRRGSGGRFAVLFMDLDRFKVINDSEGHLIGDDLLIEVGKRIHRCLKADDVVARLGGDEFGVLLGDVADTASACRVAKRIIGSLNEPFQLGDKELFTSTSIGVAMAHAHYTTPDELLRDADAAMYRAKAQGRHRCEVFDDAMRRHAVALLEVQNDIRYGLTRNEFVPYYQPVVDLATGGVVGYEALVRWLHPRRGVLLPKHFLAIAGEMGAMAALDWQVFTQACGDINKLSGDQDTFVSINLSAHHFNDAEFVQRLMALLAEHGVAPARLRVEMTEHALLANTPEVKRTLDAFNEAGIHVALDDFGTGYSSLSYLHRYPLQTLKVDKSFVANLVEGGDDNSNAVIRSVLAMAQMLSIDVIAEGVETVRQRDVLSRLGCRYVQGFLYSEAQPAAAWAKNGPPRFSM